jgi:ubiquitin conjugation factor E4 B
MKRDAEELESGRPSWSNSPQAREFEAQLKHLTDEVKKGKAQLKASEAQLLDPQFLQITVTWISFMMTWLVRVADPKQTHPKPTVELPLPQEVPLRFKMLPEHIFEDVCEILLFLGR